MPTMPRFNKKATKIAYAILGKPHNMRKDPRRSQKGENIQAISNEDAIEKRLTFEETQRAR